MARLSRESACERVGVRPADGNGLANDAAYPEDELVHQSEQGSDPWRQEEAIPSRDIAGIEFAGKAISWPDDGLASSALFCWVERDVRNDARLHEP